MFLGHDRIDDDDVDDDDDDGRDYDGPNADNCHKVEVIACSGGNAPLPPIPRTTSCALAIASVPCTASLQNT